MKNVVKNSGKKEKIQPLKRPEGTAGNGYLSFSDAEELQVTETRK